tara:strand:+ start:1984 stop:2781 length:798 start_codon:yes stop_codon:yes gene_type:complete
MSVLPQPSNRTIREQFSEGTTIDSDRIQGALDTVEARINEIPRGDILPRYVEQTIHAGFAPSRGVVVGVTLDIPFYGPWNPIRNTSGNVDAAGVDKIENPVRIKGCYNVSVGTADSQYAWSTSVNYIKPCIITELHFNMITGGLWSTWGGAGDSAHVLISVDSDSDKNDRHLNSFEAVKHNFSDSSWRFRRGAARAPDADMRPLNPTKISGNIVSLVNLGVAVPAGARVRYQIVLPGVAAAGWSVTPWNRIAAGLTVHYLEEVVK